MAAELGDGRAESRPGGDGAAPARLLGARAPRAPARLTPPRCCGPHASVGDMELALQGPRLAGRRPARVGRPRCRRRLQMEAFIAGAQEAAPAAVRAGTGRVARHALAAKAGHLDQADTFASRRPSAPGSGPRITAPQYYAVQLLAHSARAAADRRARARRPRPDGHQSPSMPGWRATLATVLCETDRLDEAANELGRAGAPGFRRHPARRGLDGLHDAPGRRRQRAGRFQSARNGSMSCCCRTGASNVVIGLAAVCLGATARCLGTAGDGDGGRGRGGPGCSGTLPGAQHRPQGAWIQVAHTAA